MRFGYQHFAFLGTESQWAAEASECASDQGAFWEYHDLLFAKQSGENGGAFGKENLKQFAAGLGLNTGAFDECLDSGKHAAAVQSQTEYLRSLGVSSTPTFLINGQPIIGSESFEAFQKIIEQELDK